MIDKIQTLGLAAKGLVYSIIGALTALVALDMGGEVAGRSEVVHFLQNQPFGNFILYLLSIGILAYVLWRLYTAIADPKRKGSDTKGLAKRFGYLCSAFIYLLFSISIFLSAWGATQNGGTREYYVSQLMEKNYGPSLIALVGLILIGVGIYQMYRGYSGKFLEDLNPGHGSRASKIKKVGKYGYMARGVVFGLLGYFVFQAGLMKNAGMVRGIEGAFTFLEQQSYGTYMMGIVALGLLGYGVFTLYASKDSRIYS